MTIYARGRTPVLYLGDAVYWVSDHPTAPPTTLHGEVTRLGDVQVTVYCEELDALIDMPYGERFNVAEHIETTGTSDKATHELAELRYLGDGLAVDAFIVANWIHDECWPVPDGVQFAAEEAKDYIAQWNDARLGYGSRMRRKPTQCDVPVQTHCNKGPLLRGFLLAIPAWALILTVLHFVGLIA